MQYAQHMFGAKTKIFWLPKGKSKSPGATGRRKTTALIMLVYCKISYVSLIDLLGCAPAAAIPLTASCILTFCFNSCQLYEGHGIFISWNFLASSSLVPFAVVYLWIKKKHKLINNRWAWSRYFKGWWSWLAIRQEGGGIHGNPASGHHQRHCHSELVSGVLTKSNTYQGEWEEGKTWKLSKQMTCWNRPTSK